MKPEELASHLKDVPDLGLRAVILYGSAAAGDRAERGSDYNILIVLEAVGRRELDLLAPVVRPWLRAGNPPPLLFTKGGLRSSADVFPIELLDMKDCRRVLHGDDALADIEVDRRNLRHELEHELKGKLIHLRREYLASGGRPAAVASLLGQSLSTFLVLFRAALRLSADRAPAAKMDAARELAAGMGFDLEPFERIRRLKEGAERIPDAEVGPLFDRYLSAIEKASAAIDRMA